MITKQQYVEYLICTIGNYTSSHLAEHLDDVSHDVVTDYLRSEHLTARGLWELVDRLIQDSPEAFLLVDDSVQDKRYSQFIELVKLQYSGAEHGLVRGIGIVNLVHSSCPFAEIFGQILNFKTAIYGGRASGSPVFTGMLFRCAKLLGASVKSCGGFWRDFTKLAAKVAFEEEIRESHFIFSE